MTKQPALFFCVFSFLFLIRSQIFASQIYDVLFEDNFTSLRTDLWEVNNLGGNISTQSGLLLTANDSRQFPFIFSKSSLIPTEGDYFINVTYEFPQATPFGVGFGIGNLVPEYGSSQTEITSIDKELFHFLVWRSSNDLFLFQTRHCLTLFICDLSRTTLFQKNYTTVPHILQIKYIGNNFVVHSDGQEIINSALTNTSRRSSIFWIGNSEKLNTIQNWTSINIKNIQIGKISEVAEVGKVPVVIVPGFGGSWDLEAILAGTPGTRWAIPSFIKNYDGIIQSFKNAGFVEDENLFVFPYDWRKPLSSLADDLKTFVDGKNLAGKVDLIGHSMGGLVARSYAQKHGTGKVNKILTAGSPHLGLIDMYGLWEGAKIWDGVWWQNVLLEIATEINRQPEETKVAAIRRVSPSVLDLFPTFPFLVSGGSTLGIDTMIQQNQNLRTMNLSADTLGDKLTPFWSDDIASTRNRISVVPRTNADILEAKWEDGKPTDGDPFGKTPGDGTVTKESAIGPFGAGEKLAGWHSDLLSNQGNIGTIFGKLGLDPSLAVSSETDTRTNSFVAVLRSPGTLEVCNLQLTLCGEQLGGMNFPEFKLFILPGYSNSDLVVRVKETGDTGAYKLYLGSIDDSPDWMVEQGNLSHPGQIDFYGVKNDNGNISVTPDNVPPTVVISSPENKFYTTTSVPALTYSVSDNWDLNPVVVANGWSGAEGEHTITVSATDRAGNVGLATVKYTIQNEPTSKDQCKKNRWRLFRFLRFKNQGQCESYYEKHRKLGWPWFFTFWNRYER